MLKKLIFAFCCFGLAMSIPFDSVGQTGSSTSIKATARVAPTGGMTEANAATLDLTGRNEILESGSHLFWLYYPQPGRVQVEVTGPGIQSKVTQNEGIASDNFLQWIQYPYASLIEVKNLPAAGDPFTITLIFTDN